MNRFFEPNGDFTGLGALIAIILMIVLCYGTAALFNSWMS